MVVRLGAVTGVGHARLINERFGKFWGAFSVGDLFILNFLTIVTEFIGVSLSLALLRREPYISVPIAALGLVAMTASGSFRRWERFMFVFIVANFLVIPLAVFATRTSGAFIHGLSVPGVTGGFNSTSVLLIIAIVGTTVAPWQLFFQQSNIVDKRITPRWINYERADTVIGSLVTVFAASLIIAGRRALAFAHTQLFGDFTDAAGRRPRACALRRATARDDVRDHPAQRLDHRRGGGHARDLVRIRRHLRGAALAAPGLARRQVLLWHVLGHGRARGRYRAHSRSARSGSSPLASRHSPACCFRAHGVLAAAVQRQGGARSLGQPAVVEPGRQLHRLDTVWCSRSS